MRPTGKGKSSKVEKAFDVESTLISIGDFDSVKATEQFAKDGYHIYIKVTVERDGKTASVKVPRRELNRWKRKCESEGRFKSIAYPIREKLEEKLRGDST